jgi:hypothetical protein
MVFYVFMAYLGILSSKNALFGESTEMHFKNVE